MADRFKYSEVRQKIIDAIRTDLIGPRDKEEVLEENPRYAYLVGMLDIQSDDEDYSGAGEQEVDADMAFEDGEDFTAGEDDDNEPISTTHFQLPSSIGISFYIQSDTESINLDVTWEIMYGLLKNTQARMKRNTAEPYIPVSRWRRPSV